MMPYNTYEEEFNESEQALLEYNNSIIHIFLNSEEEIEYDIYQSMQDLDDGNPYDGGVCTGSFENAIEMAVLQSN